MYRLIKDKVLFGVCGGLADLFDIDPLYIRVALVIATFMSFGTMLLLYVVLALSFPPKENGSVQIEPSFLGVCYKLHQQKKLDVGLLRLITCCTTILSGGFAAIIYLILHFIIPESKNQNVIDL